MGKMFPKTKKKKRISKPKINYLRDKESLFKASIDSILQLETGLANDKFGILRRTLKSSMEHYVNKSAHNTEYYQNPIINRIYDEIVTDVNNLTLLIKGMPGTGKSIIALSIAEKIQKTVRKHGFTSKIHIYSDLGELFKDFKTLERFSIVIMDESIKQIGDGSGNNKTRYNTMVDTLRAKSISFINCSPGQFQLLKDNKFTFETMFYHKESKDSVMKVYARSNNIADSRKVKYDLIGYYITEFPSKELHERYLKIKEAKSQDIVDRGGLMTNTSEHITKYAQDMYNIIQPLIFNKEIKKIPTTTKAYRYLYETYVDTSSSFTNKEFDDMRNHIELIIGGLELPSDNNVFNRFISREEIEAEIRKEMEEKIATELDMNPKDHIISFEEYQKYHKSLTELFPTNYIERQEYGNKPMEPLYKYFIRERNKVLSKHTKRLKACVVAYRLQSKGYSNRKIAIIMGKGKKKKPSMRTVSTYLSRIKGLLAEELSDKMEHYFRLIEEKRGYRVSYRPASKGVPDILSFDPKHAVFNITSQKCIYNGGGMKLSIKDISPEYTMFKLFRENNINVNIYLQVLIFDNIKKNCFVSKVCLNDVREDWKLII